MNNEQPQLNNLELKAAAQAYWEQGLAIVPFTIGQDGKKKPVITEWGQWQTRRQTKEELDALHIERYTMFGVVCGTKTINRDYFCVIDRDVKDGKLTEEIKEKTLKAIYVKVNDTYPPPIHKLVNLANLSKIELDT